MGAELFLHERAFEDCLERIAITNCRYARALLIGCPDPRWAGELGSIADQVDVCDPGALFAAASRGTVVVEDAWNPPPGAFDLVLALGTLDTVNDLPLALRLIRYAMSPGGFFLAALAGGDLLPQLRAAMRAADSVLGVATPHVHPRIEAAALAPLAAEAGFLSPVVDVDRVSVSYSSLDRLVSDLRLMGATNVLKSRPRFISRSALAAATAAFRLAADGGRTRETFEILHLAAWTAKEG